MKKTSLFNLFCIGFRIYLKFDRILIYNDLLFLPSKRLRDATIVLQTRVFSFVIKKKMKAATRFPVQ